MGRRELGHGRRALSATGLSGSFLIAGALLMALGCGGLVASPTTADSTESAELERQIVALRRQLTVSEVELGRLRTKVAELETALAKAQEAASCPEALGDRGIDDQTPVTWPSTIEASEIDVADLVQPEPPPATERPVEALPAPRQPPRPVDAAAQALYDEGYTLFHQEHYQEAEQRFSRFLELHPTTDLSDNALFWIGESRYAHGDYHAALSAFSDTVERFPEGNKVADALLKAGKCLEAVGDRDRARETYAEVAQRFPETAAAAAARELLTRLR